MGRVPWAKILSEQEATEYTVPVILSGEDGWQPFEGMLSFELASSKLK
jgi:pectinesterase